MNSTPVIPSLVAVAFGFLLFIGPAHGADDGQLHLTLRSRLDKGDASATLRRPAEKAVTWNPKNTALIICDMWDDHWCKSASLRVAELAAPMNELVKIARAKGVFVIHSPS